MRNRPSTTRRADGQPVILVLMIAAAAVLPALLFVLLSLHEKDRRVTGLTDKAAVAALVGRERALGMIQASLLALERLDDTTAGLSWPQVQARRANLQAEIRRLELAQPVPTTLFLLRADGRVAASGVDETVSTADLAIVQTLREGATGPAFDAVAAGELGSGAKLLVARQRATEVRGREGLLLAAIQARGISAEWDGLGQAGGRFALLRDDGVVLLRQDAQEGVPLILPAQNPLRLAMREGASGRLAADPFGNDEPSIVAWQRVGDYPLVLAYTVPVAAWQQGWVQAMGPQIAICLTLSLLMTIAAVRLRRRKRADDATLARLEAHAEELQAEITRREAAEDSLRNAQRLEGLGRLTGGVAHDFNNLLTAILGTARALERHLGPRADERTKRLLAATVTAVDRGARLNASLLAFARRQPLTLTTVDANALLRDFLPLLRRALDESVSVELALDQKLPTCNADAAQLEAALLNLAINARDAMPRGGKLRVVTRRAWLQEQALAGNPEAQPGPYVAIEVRDTGEGMTPEVRERAFEPFFTTKAAGQGTGLGLSQVFGFVRQIGGHVAIQSAPRRGTTITLYLPLGSATEVPVGGTVPPVRVAARSGIGLSVLVVEDEPAVRAVAVDMLQDAGFAVLAAPDGPTALALLREGAQADILFSDVVMPGGMTGVDLAREARRLRPEIGVLLASGYAAEALAEHGGAGEFEILGKPYDVETVLTRIAAQRTRQKAAAAG